MTARQAAPPRAAMKEAANDHDTVPHVQAIPDRVPVARHAPAERVATSMDTCGAVRRRRGGVAVRGEREHPLDDRGSRTSGPRLRELLCEYRPKLDGAGRSIYLGSALRHSGDAAELLSTVLSHHPVELFGILCLTVRRQVICWHLVTRGWIDGAYVDPRAVFQAALVANARAIILAHNHPSGDPTPSSPDTDLTRDLIKAGDLLGVHVLDHIIIGDGTFASVRSTATFPQRWDTSYRTDGPRPALGGFASDLACTVGPLVCTNLGLRSARRRAGNASTDV